MNNYIIVVKFLSVVVFITPGVNSVFFELLSSVINKRDLSQKEKKERYFQNDAYLHDLN